MEAKEILSRYAYYYEYIQMVGERVPIKELPNQYAYLVPVKTKRGTENRIYNEIKELKEVKELNIPLAKREYLWLVSILFIFWLCKNIGLKTIFEISDNIFKFEGFKSEIAILSLASRQHPVLLDYAFHEVFGRKLEIREQEKLVELFYSKISSLYRKLS